jgi:hypothetical protein
MTKPTRGNANYFTHWTFLAVMKQIQSESEMIPSSEIAERNSRDGRDELGIQSVHVAPFSHVSRFTRHGLWRWQTSSALG